MVGRRAPTHVKQGVLIPAQALPSAVGQGREGYTGLLAASLSGLLRDCLQVRQRGIEQDT